MSLDKVRFNNTEQHIIMIYFLLTPLRVSCSGYIAPLFMPKTLVLLEARSKRGGKKGNLPFCLVSNFTHGGIFSPFIFYEDDDYL